MDESLKKIMIGLFAEVLPLQKTAEDRMKKLEEFDEACGADIPDWTDLMKAKIIENGSENAQDAVKAVDAFYAKYHVYDENGKPIFERRRIGNSHHQIVITYDSKAPEGLQFSVREVPDVDSMSLKELQAYYDELLYAISDLEDEEPEDEDSDEHSAWEDRYSELEDLIEEIGEKLEEVGGDVE